MILLQRIQELTKDVFPSVVAWRRQLHAHPELAYQETETAKLVAETLTNLGFEVQTGIAHTGVVALLRGKNAESHCIALRADMDALPIHEQNEVPYKSTITGCMHACGHDFHTANLLGVATVLAALKEELEGTIKFIFQPSEEKMPSGADALIALGVLENPQVKKIYGLHVHPELEAGEVGFCAGNFMASADEIYITAIGKGGHAAQPQNFISPLLIAAEIVSKLQAETDLTKRLVLSFGKLIAAGATNIIPEKATIDGTLRCFDESQRQQMHQHIIATCNRISAAHAGTCEVNIVRGYPVLKNDETLTHRAINVSKLILNTTAIHELPLRMGAEDFAFYSQQIPACFFRVGVGNKSSGITAPIHSPTFNVDEEAFKTSIALMSCMALDAANSST